MKTKFGMIFIILTSSLVSANSESIHIPNNDRQPLNIANQPLSVDKLYNSYLSKQVSERRLAEMYFIGVIDSTEGTEWCGFQSVKATSVQELAFSAIEAAIHTKPSERASKVIISKLHNTLPCKEQK
ncbi:hypothetical protein CW745_15010 [Psychromonas sp. psych-6C06]|uniref:Rap1a/Tai family immunity protein n=1 Tax=Psychromonas sp. psych-6C06 TaxID=2058089 RepID=UPI000C34E4AB|nr:Rap1a/Tai family immunity protein [Psychromonas sp. psych-6C06]PKF60375.1 hypothetical protein CW745_15010 [Psychromonas sp. psych-6C06]